jgi:hypothetical protein
MQRALWPFVPMLHKRQPCLQYAAIRTDPSHFQQRFVLLQADHVWCEYWSEGLGRWVHADPCEAAWDRPLLYEVCSQCAMPSACCLRGGHLAPCRLAAHLVA